MKAIGATTTSSSKHLFFFLFNEVWLESREYLNALKPAVKKRYEAQCKQQHESDNQPTAIIFFLKGFKGSF